MSATFSKSLPACPAHLLVDGDHSISGEKREFLFFFGGLFKPAPEPRRPVPGEFIGFSSFFGVFEGFKSEESPLLEKGHDSLGEAGSVHFKGSSKRFTAAPHHEILDSVVIVLLLFFPKVGVIVVAHSGGIVSGIVIASIADLIRKR